MTDHMSFNLPNLAIIFTLSTHSAPEHVELLPVHLPGPPKLLPLSARPAVGTTVVVVSHGTLGVEDGLTRQQPPHCLLCRGQNCMDIKHMHGHGHWKASRTDISIQVEGLNLHAAYFE